MAETEQNKPEELTVKEKMDRAFAKEKLYGELGLNAQDHRDMGSTPTQELHDNEGKTQADLMTDEQILKWFEDNEIFAQELEQSLAKKKSRNDEYILRVVKHNLEGGIRYLESIGRLPAKYSEKEK